MNTELETVETLPDNISNRMYQLKYSNKMNEINNIKEIIEEDIKTFDQFSFSQKLLAFLSPRSVF